MESAPHQLPPRSSSRSCAPAARCLLLPQGRSSYLRSPTLLGSVFGLLSFATLLCALWSILPRRNVAVDIEERDGAALADPARSWLKTMRTTAYGSNPFAADPVPQRRGMSTAEAY